jgi:addiction module HigA family antidote
MAMTMKNPAHPGEVLDDVLGPDGLNISISEAARRLGVSRVMLSRVVNGRSAVSPELAVRLERANLSTARMWLAMQVQYDLSKALKRKRPRIVPFAWQNEDAA